MNNSVRINVVADLLTSYRDLTSGIVQLTIEELYYALELEAGTQRRPTIIDRLIRRIIALESEKLRLNLRNKYYGNTQDL